MRKLTLYQFQKIDTYMSRKDISDINKSFYSVCVVYDLTEHALDQMDVRKVYKMVNRVNRMLKESSLEKVFKQFGEFTVCYNPVEYTLGQFISLSFYLSSGYMANAHKILGVATGQDEANDRADYFREQPMRRLTGGLKQLMLNFKGFLHQYKDLFGLSVDNAEEVQANPFQKKYGWIFSATMIAEHCRITLDDAFKMNVVDAFFHLGYLKAKAKYDEQQIKRK